MIARVEIGDAILFCGDYRDNLPKLGKYDAIVTDPPYGIGFHAYNSHKDTELDYSALIAPLKGIPLALLQYPEEMMRLVVPILGAPDECLAWVYPSNLRRQFRLWGLWNLQAEYSKVLQPAKNPECAKVTSSHVSSYDWWEQPQVKGNAAEKTAHPCQIPVTLVERVIKLIDKQSIMDPFMGSGTTGVACARLGCKFIGIEKDREYFNIACERITAAYAQGQLFKPERIGTVV